MVKELDKIKFERIKMAPVLSRSGKVIGKRREKKREK